MTCPILRYWRILAILAGLAHPGAQAAQCSAESGPRRVPLLELYTSEGCDSCPAADRWLSSLAGRGLDTGQLVALGFHIDYWNYLGWKDPYAKADYSERQRTASRRNNARVIYTPQLLLNGKDYRRGTPGDDLSDRVRTINAEPVRARLSLRLAVESPDALVVQGVAAATEPATAYLALYENHLFSEITAGENRGKRLQHDYVVRELVGPFAVKAPAPAAFDRRFKLDPRWKTADLRLAAFVQSEITGDVLQSLALPYCR